MRGDGLPIPQPLGKAAFGAGRPRLYGALAAALAETGSLPVAFETVEAQAIGPLRRRLAALRGRVEDGEPLAEAVAILGAPAPERDALARATDGEGLLRTLRMLSEREEPLAFVLLFDLFAASLLGTIVLLPSSGVTATHRLVAGGAVGLALLVGIPALVEWRRVRGQALDAIGTPEEWRRLRRRGDDRLKTLAKLPCTVAILANLSLMVPLALARDRARQERFEAPYRAEAPRARR